VNDGDTSLPVLLASAAVSVCDTWPDPEKRREQVLAVWAQLGSDPDLLLAAAGEVAALPQPLPDAVDEIERKARIRELLGARSPEDELLSMLDARALLEQLAREQAE